MICYLNFRKERLLRYNQKTLIINNVNQEDGGIYFCNGTNKVGSTVKYFFIFVLGKDLKPLNNAYFHHLFYFI